MSAQAKKRPTLRVCKLLVVVACLPVSALAQDATIVWQSRNDTYAELTQEFAALYRDLLTIRAKGGALPTAVAPVPAGRTITEVLRDRGLFDGKALPRQLDVLVCQLNPRVCKVTPGSSGDVRDDDAAAAWKVQPNDEIVLPDIRLQPVIVHKPYQKNAGDTLKSIVVDVRQGCSSFDEVCQQYIQNLNRRSAKPVDTDYSGRIVVPTKAYRAVIPVDAAVNLEDLVKEVPTLARRAVPSSQGTLHDGANDVARQQAREADRAQLLALIHHPLATVNHLDLPATAHATVAVFDSWVDPTHCMLANLTVLDPDQLGRVVPKATTCGERGEAIGATDHGTHVVGLIGTRNGVAGGPGINPYATIQALCLDVSQFRLPTYLATQSDRLRSLYMSKPPDVVNLSFEYSLTAEASRNDVFLAAIRELESDTLFVTSAGNDRLSLSRTGECRVRPACFDEPNVVTVAALDLDKTAPALLSGEGGSNFGDRVHLGSPGQNIVSTIAGDRLGVLGGTSQAAPSVAGAASLLYLYVSKLQAPQVKNRLIYTSDLYADLYDKLVGGRLNVDRLLHYKRATLELKAGRRLEASSRLPETAVRFKDFQTGEVVKLNFSQVRRLMFNPDLNYYTLFYNDEVGRDTGTLHRRFVTFTNGAVKLAFAIPVSGGTDKREEVAVGDILDYVSPLLL